MVSHGAEEFPLPSNDFKVLMLENRVAALEAKVDALEEIVREQGRIQSGWETWLRELWNSWRTLYAVLHPNNMTDTFVSSGTAEQASNGTANIFIVCYNPATKKMFFKPTMLSDSFSRGS